MNKIIELINDATDAILHFSFKDTKQTVKIVAIIIAVVGGAIILLAAFFSLVPQF